MRRFFLILVATLVCGGIIGLLMNQDVGYVLISYGSITIESSIWVFAVFLIATLFVLGWCKDILVVALRPGSIVTKLTGSLTYKRASKNTINGLFELMGGNWNKAEKLLTSSANHVPYAAINYIGAAYAASEQGAYERSKNLLRSAHQISPGSDFVISFAQSQIQLRQNHFETALATLLRLHKIQPKHRQVLKMLVQAYSKLNDWEALLALTPALKKEGILDDTNILELEKNAFESLLNDSRFTKTVPNTEAVKAIESIWNKLSGISSDESMQLIYANALIRFNDEPKAEVFIRKSLKQNWSHKLVKIYGNLSQINTLKALQQAESWLVEKPHDAYLLFTCGRLSQQQKLWGKAKDYYQLSLSNNAITNKLYTETVTELSRLLNAMGEHEASQALFLKSLDYNRNHQTVAPLPLPQRQN
ncbi:heme biosynthesis protein HemY [Marinomonas agarivorans]|nr:heme biosynthesis protein HemY [Marinomonas agarivorans]